MYQILIKDRLFICRVEIQDGRETWNESNLNAAVESVIEAAKTMNGMTITKEDIQIIDTLENQNIITSVPKSNEVSEFEKQLLRDIHAGNKVVLESSDPRIKMNISIEDCELLVKIREGEIKICQDSPKKTAVKKKPRI